MAGSHQENTFPHAAQSLPFPNIVSEKKEQRDSSSDSFPTRLRMFTIMWLSFGDEETNMEILDIYFHPVPQTPNGCSMRNMKLGTMK